MSIFYTAYCWADPYPTRYQRGVSNHCLTKAEAPLGLCWKHYTDIIGKVPRNPT